MPPVALYAVNPINRLKWVARMALYSAIHGWHVPEERTKGVGAANTPIACRLWEVPPVPPSIFSVNPKTAIG